MKKTDEIEKYRSAISKIIQKIRPSNFILREEYLVGTRTVDLDAVVQAEGDTYELMIEVASNGTPGAVRQLISKIQALEGLTERGRYPVIAVPYLSEVGLRICREAQIGAFDLAGNCYLSFGRVYIEISGNKNPSPAKQDLSLFSPKSSRILRVLLTNPGAGWQVQSLAREAEVSLGLASRVKEMLREGGYVVEENRRIKLASVFPLLEDWSKVYTYKKNNIYEYFSQLDSRTIERVVRQYCDENRLRSALTLLSAASRVAPMVVMDKAFLYVEKDIPKLADRLGFKSVSSGANVMLLQPYDPGVFYKSEAVEDVTVVSTVQLYLDLVKFKGRGEEAAEFLRQTTLENDQRRNG